MKDQEEVGIDWGVLEAWSDDQNGEPRRIILERVAGGESFVAHAVVGSGATYESTAEQDGMDEAIASMCEILASDAGRTLAGAGDDHDDEEDEDEEEDDDDEDDDD